MNFSTPETRLKVCKLLNVQEEQFVKDVNYLREWLSQQAHLPKIELNDNFIGNCLIRNKFSIEQTKKALDMFFTIRSIFPEVYRNKDPNIISKVEHYDDNVVMVLPKCTEDLQQAAYVSVARPNSLNFTLLMQKIFNALEFKFQEDLSMIEIVIVNFKNFSIEDILRISPTLVVKSIKCYQSIFKFRAKAIYIINNKPYIDPLIRLFKSMVKDKVFQRIHFDLGTDCLQKTLPKDMLPSDFGGEQLSVQELSKKSDLELLRNCQFFDSIANIEVNEELRPKELLSNADNTFGMYGNFKQLSLD